MKVSENIVVRRLAGASLLAIAPALTPDRRNEVAVELSKVLETGQTEISQYIPSTGAQFAVADARELDRDRGSDADPPLLRQHVVVAAALATVGAMLEHYAVYAQRFRESREVLGTPLAAAGRPAVEGPGLLSSERAAGGAADPGRADLRLTDPLLRGKAALFTLMAKKILFLLGEQPGTGAELLLHRRGPLPHLPLHRLLSD